MNSRLQLSLDSSLPEIGVAHEKFSEFATRQGLAASVQNACHVALEEVLINIISHGCKNTPGSPIWVEIKVEGDEVCVVIEDSAPLFNPLERPPPNLAIPATEREPGGLGIFLLRSMMDKVDYSRDSGRNRLVLRKRLESHSPMDRPIHVGRC